MEKQTGHQKLIKIISTGLGIGYIPFMPGTLTSLAVIIVYWFWNPQGNAWVIFTLIIIIVAMMVAHSAEKYFNKKDDLVPFSCSLIKLKKVAAILHYSPSICSLL